MSITFAYVDTYMKYVSPWMNTTRLLSIFNAHLRRISEEQKCGRKRQIGPNPNPITKYCKYGQKQLTVFIRNTVRNTIRTGTGPGPTGPGRALNLTLVPSFEYESNLLHEETPTKTRFD